MGSLGVGDDETTCGGAQLSLAAESVPSSAAIALEAVRYRRLTYVQFTMGQNTVSATWERSCELKVHIRKNSAAHPT